MSFECEIYVSTYGKYNQGSLAGSWVDLTQFSNKDKFLEFCHELHKDEFAPELMTQDVSCELQGIADLINEDPQGIDEQVFELLTKDEEEIKIIDAFMFCFGAYLDQAIKNAMDAFVGEYKDDEDFAWEMHEQTKEADISHWPYNCIDWERAARELMYDYSEHDGYYFMSNW